MPNLGGPELIILVLVIVVLFGWKKLPDAARSLGRSMRIFKAEVEEMKDKPSAASRDTVQGQAHRPATSETVRPEDHRTSTTEATQQAAPQSPVQEAPGTGGQDTYRPPMA